MRQQQRSLLRQWRQEKTSQTIDLKGSVIYEAANIFF
jgi:hypothetical protein